MSDWKPIDSAPKDEPILLGHNPKWQAPLPMYWSASYEEWTLEIEDMSGRGLKYGIGFSGRHGPPTHWDYCPLPPSREEPK